MQIKINQAHDKAVKINNSQRHLSEHGSAVKMMRTENKKLLLKNGYNMEVQKISFWNESCSTTLNSYLNGY